MSTTLSNQTGIHLLAKLNNNKESNNHTHTLGQL